MTNVLGGGGGKDGFRHIVSHLGPASQKWTKDMHDHAFIFSDATVQKLDNSVQDMLGGGNAEHVEQQRDEALVDFIKRKRDATAFR
jgi:3-hydroxyacyl-CoA dehydrogenase